MDFMNLNFDEEGWPIIQSERRVATFKAGEQSVLMKEAIVVILSKKT
jgi:hypothetical protein